MKPLFDTNEVFKRRSSGKTFPLECEECGKTFYRLGRHIRRFLSGIPTTQRGRKVTGFIGKFCSNRCSADYKIKTQNITKPCAHCSSNVTRHLKDFQKSKNGNIFCNQSCAASFNNKNKTSGYRRSQIEIWLEKELTDYFPKLDISYNDKRNICSELDIYIPSLRLAFEINGIFHYQPIYGAEKLSEIQANDADKINKCQQANINLHIIDISSIQRFSPKTGEPYLSFIVERINDAIVAALEGNAPSSTV